MRKAGGKAKGSEFEREVCKQLSLWWTGGKTKDAFWRNLGIPSRGSGARKESQYGDLHAISAEGEWFAQHVNVEVKFYRDLDLLEAVDKPKKQGKLIFEHWEQCKRDAEASERAPLLIQKRNHGEPFVMCGRSLAEGIFLTVSRIDLQDRQGKLVSVFPLTGLVEVSPEFFKTVVSYLCQKKKSSSPPTTV